jgi:AcrR family transcriptional regulator
VTSSGDDRPKTTSVWLRPEQAGVGRRAQRTRDEIARAAVTVADNDGLHAVTMRRVAADLGTGAGSLYRYVQTRDELLDLMADLVGAERTVGPATGDWLADLIDLALQTRAIHRRHPWMPDLVITSPRLGPRAADVLEHYLTVVEPLPADDATKLTAFAVMNALIASTVRNELSDGAAGHDVEYLTHVAAGGTHPRISALRAPASGPDDRLPDILRSVLRGFFDAQA